MSADCSGGHGALRRRVAIWTAAANYLTDRPEHRLVERFTLIAKDVWLPEFIEIYIRSDLNIELRHQLGRAAGAAETIPNATDIDWR